MRDFFRSFVVFMGVASMFFGANASNPFSQYGVIQNVQNYSSNPFWDPSRPYNQRMPQPVYVMGADVGAEECRALLNVLVAQQCARINNCVGAQLSDVRPVIMVMLSKLPEHNYATSCAGFLDEAFNNFVKTSANATTVMGPVVYPDATVPNAALGAQGVVYENPYKIQKPVWNGESWVDDIAARQQKIRELEKQSEERRLQELISEDVQ